MFSVIVVVPETVTDACRFTQYRAPRQRSAATAARTTGTRTVRPGRAG
jgi:hypothetical protein